MRMGRPQGRRGPLQYVVAAVVGIAAVEALGVLVYSLLLPLTG